MTGTVEKIKAKVDNVLHKDKTNDPTGPHSSHSANKADPRVDSDHVGTVGNTTGAGGHGTGQYGSSTHTGTHTGTGLTGTHGTTGSSGLTGTHGATHGNDPTGPHSSHIGNKADPRVDSDRYGAAGNTAGAGGHGVGQYGSNTTHTGTTGGLTGSNTHGTTGGLGSSHASDPSGPHDSKIANKLDPTVDTKSYGTAQHGTTGGLTGSHNTHGTTGGLAGSHNTHGTTGGLTGSHNTHGTTGYSDPTGPHDSHMGNKVDPRVDSDRYGATGNTAGAGGYGVGQYGTTGSSGLTGSHGATGTHSTGLTGNHGTTGSSGLTGSHGTTGTHGAGLTGTHGNTVGSGNSNNTAGPHNSDMLNKVDPRVDSDLDGSRTVGGNATYR